MSTPVFMTVPKYVAISPSPLTRITHSPALSIGMQSVCSESSSDDSSANRGKKRRLDHLSWEEKLQRKKLKNRVAAQTSRDRKKARMEEMEQTVNELTEQTDMLKNKCDSLQAINENLLAKNQKLDKEVEYLKEQLKQLQSAQQENQKHQQHQASQQSSNCVDFDSILKGSAVSLLNPLPQGMKELQSMTQGNRQERRRSNKSPQQYPAFGELSCSSVENSGALPSLQDMLEDFDATKLEELAESLLADITADLEGSNPEGHTDAPEDAGIAERLSGSVVGTTPEIMESSQYTSSCSSSDDSGICLTTTTTEPTSLLTNIDTTANLQQQQPLDTGGETIYGTYDEKTNSITIVVGDDAVAMNEAVEEVYCEGEEPPKNEETIECGMTSDDIGDDDDDFDTSFLSLPFDSKKNCLKSPLSIHSYSDPGYESIGSPQSDIGSTISTFDEMAWTNSINELFPSLL
ncbi:LOW QUALITY PROTEIN: uncharacterized protein LOC129939384 [Eupeodes corollae]|uniref:LOW QUALITY PROTEIN: uncharacterized protein LOC129939384 n=1 Tax=Eupeodes corollae TaxID=290404 RepID=UPI002492CCB8|nr:LOW QUALITY PROTEIN: uncharacterized protein LOC129939384 [Eupeodes corollae]